MSFGFSLSILTLFFVQNVSAVTFTDDILSYSIQHYNDLVKNKHIDSKVNFHKNTDPEMEKSIAYVHYDSEKDICDVFIDENGVVLNNLDFELGYKFILYHELAHCHLFKNPSDLNVFPDLSSTSNLLISDWIKLSNFELPSDVERPRPSGYGTYHETYADVKSISILLSQGVAAEQLQFVNELRAGVGALGSDTHNTSNVLPKSFSENWGGHSKAQRELRVRELTDQNLVENYFKLYYFLEFMSVDLISSLFKTNVMLPIFNYRNRDQMNNKNEMEILDFNKNFAKYSRDQPLSLIIGLSESVLTEQQAINKFFKERYNKYELEASYHEISEKLMSIGRKMSLEEIAID